MKFQITFRTPDAIYHACHDADIDPIDMDQPLLDVLNKYIPSSEFITIVFDTDSQTAEVKEVAK